MIKALQEFIETLIERKFTGSIKINFFKGGVTTINKKESIELGN